MTMKITKTEIAVCDLVKDYKENKKTRQYHIKVRNIVIGVPITFLDRYCPKQFEIETNSTMSGVSANFWTYINGSPKYARIFIRKKPK